MKNSISICMGSSCFVRGNEEHLRTIENFIEENRINIELKLIGSRCVDECILGPNISINGKDYHKVDRGTLLDVLQELPGYKEKDGHE